MKFYHLLGAAVAVAALAGCNGGQLTPAPPAGTGVAGAQNAFSRLSAQRLLAMTVANAPTIHQHTDHGKSWMLPEAAGSKLALLYAGSWDTNDVYVFDYKSGKLVGTLTGFDYPYAGCVDAKGDVYLTNFDNGEVVEYERGGTSPVKTWTTSGYAIGCSVDKNNDLAVTDFYTSTGAGQIEVFAKGGSSGVTYSDASACYYMWPAGYDNKGNLIVVGEYSSIVVCALKAGASSMSTLSYSGTIDFPGGTMWDGKYIALGDQEANGTYETGLDQVTLSGSTLTEVGSTTLTDTCDSDYVDIPAPFVVGKKNTPVNRKQGYNVVGGNIDCADDGIGVWKYPAGGDPFRAIGSGSSVSGIYGSVVSVGK